MSLPLILRPQAEADVDAIRGELDGLQVGLGQRFAVRLRDVLERIEAMPELYGVVWRDVRAARVKQFRYVVYHVYHAAFPDRVEVLPVMHGSRDTSAWHSRV